MTEFLGFDDSFFDSLGWPGGQLDIDVEVDFTSELMQAMRNAKFVDLTPSGQHPQAAIDELERLKALESEDADSLIQGDDTSMDQASEVYAHNAHEFPILYRQALELAFPSATKEQIDQEVVLVTDHEMDHVVAANMIGKTPLLGIRMMKIHTRPGRYAYRVMAFTAFPSQDKITKADHAFIAAAGGDFAERDLAILRSLGYSSPEEALDTHPLFRQSE